MSNNAHSPTSGFGRDEVKGYVGRGDDEVLRVKLVPRDSFN